MGNNEFFLESMEISKVSNKGEMVLNILLYNVLLVYAKIKILNEILRSLDSIIDNSLTRRLVFGLTELEQFGHVINPGLLGK